MKTLPQALFKKTVTFSVLILYSLSLYAQPGTPSPLLKSTAYSIEKLLPGQLIRQIFQDTRGVFWVLSSEGLYNYDGNTIYPVHSKDDNFLPLRLSVEDQNNLIWIEYSSDGAQHNWKAFNIFTRQEVAAKEIWGDVLDIIVDISVNAERQLFASTASGQLWAMVNNVPRILADNLPGAYKFCGAPHSQLIWLTPETTSGSAGQHVIGLDIASKQYKKVEIPVPFSCQVANKDLLLLTDTEWGILNSWGSIKWSSLETLIPDFQKNKDIRNKDFEFSIYLPEKDEWWISYKNTLYVSPVFDTSKKTVKYDQILFAGSQLFKGNKGSVLLSEATHFKQLLTYEAQFHKIAWQNPYENTQNAMETVFAVTDPGQGQVYFGTDTGINSWNPTAQKTQKLLESSAVKAMQWDQSKQLIWALTNEALIAWNIRSGTPKYFSLPENIVGKSSFLFLSQDKLYLGGKEGISVFHTGNNEFSPFTRYNGYKELATADIYSFFKESDEEYWVLSSTGIYGLHPEKGVLWQQHAIADKQINRAFSAVRHVLRDSDGVYWMATYEGLLYWDKKQGIYKLITQSDNLPTNKLQSVYKGDEDELWLGSDWGLIALNKNTLQSRFYTSEDGISDNIFVAGAHTQSTDGTLYLGSRNGLTAFKPNAILSNTPQPEALTLSLMSALIYSAETGSRDDLSHFYENGAIALQPEDVAMEIHFAVPLRPDIKQVKLSYLAGADEEEWIPFPGYSLKLATKSRQDTILKIKATTQGISTQESIISIPIRYNEVNYFEPWLYALPVLLFLLTLLWYLNLLPVPLKPSPPIHSVSENSPNTEWTVPDQAELPEAKVNLFTGIAHELRTPLSLILGPVKYLSQNSRLDKQGKAMLDTISQNAGFLLNQVDELLLLNALDQNRFREQLELFHPEEWFEARLKGFDLLADKKRIYFNRQYDWKGRKQLYHHKQWIGIIANNLVANAIKFTPNGGTISLEASVNDSELQIICTDNGQGIHPEDQPHIFKRYFQSQREGAPLEGGSGIGLALIKELTRHMGGMVSMQSEWGKGATFKVRLPLPQEPAGEFKTEATTVAPNATLPKLKIPGGQTILMVEDHPDFQDYLRLTLGKDYEVRTAANGKEALTLLKGGLRPSLILTDLMMPEMDGYQLLKTLKRDDAWKQIPVVVLSVRSDVSDKKKAIELGAASYLSKPFEEIGLLATLHKLIASQKITGEKESTEVKEEESDENWLEQLALLVEKEMAEENFNVDRLAGMMLMSRTAFYKRVQQLTGMTPNQYIMESRLQKARSILEAQPKIKIKKLVRMVGLKHEGYFAKNFTQRFGYSPSDFR